MAFQQSCWSDFENDISSGYDDDSEVSYRGSDGKRRNGYARVENDAGVRDGQQKEWFLQGNSGKRGKRRKLRFQRNMEDEDDVMGESVDSLDAKQDPIVAAPMPKPNNEQADAVVPEEGLGTDWDDDAADGRAEKGRIGSPFGTQPDPRESINPRYDNLAIAVKTGGEVAVQRMPIQLVTFLRPVRNLMVLASEPNIAIGGHDVVDVFSNLYSSITQAMVNEVLSRPKKSQKKEEVADKDNVMEPSKPEKDLDIQDRENKPDAVKISGKDDEDKNGGNKQGGVDASSPFAEDEAALKEPETEVRIIKNSADEKDTAPARPAQLADEEDKLIDEADEPNEGSNVDRHLHRRSDDSEASKTKKKDEEEELIPDKESQGWKRDAHKNLPGFRELYKMYPNADWYLMIDDDTYVFMDNVHTMLSKLDPSHPWYIGNANVFVGCDGVSKFGEGPLFAHGGSGIVMSKAAMKIMLADLQACIIKYKDCWAGDVRVALCLRDLDIFITHSPGFW
ncbi:hypothetical protein HDU97_002861 [Phlyctochytrium planicorne]|nr:hypothetical protein HDU97_002861 [Phlyctochytrium planicorne]